MNLSTQEICPCGRKPAESLMCRPAHASLRKEYMRETKLLNSIKSGAAMNNRGCGNKDSRYRCRMPICDDCDILNKADIMGEKQGCGHLEPYLLCRMPDCADCKDKPRQKNVIEQVYRPENKLDTSNPPKGGSASSATYISDFPPAPSAPERIAEEAYRPQTNLDTSHEVIRTLTSDVKDVDTKSYSVHPFKLWFSGFKAAIVSYPTGEQWAELCRMIENLKD